MKRVLELNTVIDELSESAPRLIYPRYHNHSKLEIRHSEQEFRLCFIETLEKLSDNHNYYYSIETPTKLKYKFKDIPKQDNSGISARFDVSIYQKASDNHFEIIHHIEFKSENGDQNQIRKDILKLAIEETNKTHYILHIVQKNNFNTSTLVSLHNKIFCGNKKEAFLKEINLKINNRIQIYILTTSNTVNHTDPAKGYYILDYNRMKDLEIDGNESMIIEEWQRLWHPIDEQGEN